MLLRKGDSPEAIADHVIEAFSVPQQSEDFRLDLEDFTHHTLASKGFEVARFAKLMKGIDMDFEQLYVGYVGKNVLNFFRQDHGYQDGSYQIVAADKMLVLREGRVELFGPRDQVMARLVKSAAPPVRAVEAG